MKHKRNPLILPHPITPIVGFILQKDVYTTNLLYANDKFPTKSLRKALPFRKPSYMKKINPKTCLTIRKEKSPIFENNNEDIIDKSFLWKPKKLRNKRLKFPLLKLRIVPLGYSILNDELCKDNLKIKYLEDDCNITSKFGKKMKYNLRTETNSKRDLTKKKYKESFNNGHKSRNSIKLNLSDENKKEKISPIKTFFGNKKHLNDRNFKFNRIHYKNNIKSFAEKSVSDLRKDIFQINDDLRTLNMKEKEWKKSLIKKDFFATQIYTKINMEASKNQ